MNAAGCPGRHRADRDPLDEAVRVLEHQLAVLERARLGLVGVAAQVLVHVALRQEARLLAHREAGAAAPAQARRLELADQLAGLALPERALQRRVSAESLVGLDPVQSGLVDVAEQDPGLELFTRCRHLAKPTGTCLRRHLVRIGAIPQRHGLSGAFTRPCPRQPGGEVGGQLRPVPGEAAVGDAQERDAGGPGVPDGSPARPDLGRCGDALCDLSDPRRTCARGWRMKARVAHAMPPSQPIS